MKSQHIIVMVLATVTTIYVGTGVITRSAGITGRIGRLVNEASAESSSRHDDLTQLLEDLEARAQADSLLLERDPMLPREARRSTQTRTSTAPASPARSSVEVTALIIDEENPMAVLLTGGRSITVEEGDTVNGGLVVQIGSDGVVLRYEDTTRTYPYPSGK